MKPVNANDNEELLQEDDDVQFVGKELWKVLTKAYSDEEEWADTTAVMKVPGGVVMRSNYYNDDTNSMAMVFIPGADIEEDEDGNIKLV